MKEILLRPGRDLGDKHSEVVYVGMGRHSRVDLL